MKILSFPGQENKPKAFEPEDIALLGDAAWALLCVLAQAIMIEDEKAVIEAQLLERFEAQGFDINRSIKVAKMISDAINIK